MISFPPITSPWRRNSLLFEAIIKRWDCLFQGSRRPKNTKHVEVFVENHIDTHPRKPMETLREFHATLKEVKMTYRPWYLVIGWQGIYFLQAHGKNTPETRFSPFVMSCMATISEV